MEVNETAWLSDLYRPQDLDRQPHKRLSGNEYLLFLTWWYLSILPVFFNFQAKYTHGNEDRAKVTKFMSHDVKTADKFYAMNFHV